MKNSLGLIITIVLIINIILISLLVYQYQKKESTKQNSYNIIATANKLIKELQTAENAQRGFLITNDEPFLDTYNQKYTNSQRLYETLQNIFNENPAQVQTLGKVKLFMRIAFNKLNTIIELSKNKQNKQAMYIMTQDYGKQYMEKTINKLQYFVETEEKLLNIKKEAYTDFIVFIFAVIILSYFLGMIFFVLYIKQSSQTQKFEKHITKYLRLLDKHVLYTRTDIDGIITDASDAFCNLCGYKKEELIGKNHNIFKSPSTPKKLYKQMWKQITQNKSWYGEIANISKTGEEFWILANIAPEFDESGKKSGYISFKHNITDKKHLEFKDNQMKDSAKMIALGEMIGNIAHQWRQPLSAISVKSTGMLLQYELGKMDEKSFAKSMEDINDHVQYLSETIDTFSNFLKPNKTQETIELHTLTESVLNIVGSSLKMYHIEIINTISKDNTASLTLNQGELSQVLINLINNAKDVLHERDIKNPWVKIDLIQTKNTINISIEDNAGGVPNKIITKIFEPYFTTKHQSKGTGLGLYMSYKIIHESLLGDLYVDNTKHGAKFVIELPIKNKENKS